MTSSTSFLPTPDIPGSTVEFTSLSSPVSPPSASMSDRDEGEITQPDPHVMSVPDLGVEPAPPVRGLSGRRRLSRQGSGIPQRKSSLFATAGENHSSSNPALRTRRRSTMNANAILNNVNVAAPLMERWYSTGFVEGEGSDVRKQKVISFVLHVLFVMRLVTLFGVWDLHAVQITYIVVHMMAFFVAHTAYHALKTHKWIRYVLVPAVLLYPVAYAFEDDETDVIGSFAGLLATMCCVPALWIQMGGSRRTRDIIFLMCFFEYGGFMMYCISIHDPSSKVIIEMFVWLFLGLGFTAIVVYMHQHGREIERQRALIQETLAVIVEEPWDCFANVFEADLGNEVSASPSLQYILEIIKFIEELRRQHPAVLDAEVHHELNIKAPEPAPASPRNMGRMQSFQFPASPSTVNRGRTVSFTTATTPPTDTTQPAAAVGSASSPVSAPQPTSTIGGSGVFRDIPRHDSLSLADTTGCFQMTLMYVEVSEVLLDNTCFGSFSAGSSLTAIEDCANVINVVLAHARKYGGVPLWSCGLEIYIVFSNKKLMQNASLAAAAAAWTSYNEFKAAKVYPYISLTSCTAAFGTVGADGERKLFVGQCSGVSRCRELTMRARRDGQKFVQVDVSVVTGISTHFNVDADQITSPLGAASIHDIGTIVKPLMTVSAENAAVTTMMRRGPSMRLATFLQESGDELISQGESIKSGSSYHDLFEDHSSPHFAPAVQARRGHRGSSVSSGSSRAQSIFTVDGPGSFSESAAPSIPADVMAAWRRYDKQGHGTITAEEVWWLLHDIGLKVSTEKFFHILQILDPTGTEIVTLSSVTSLLRSDVLAGNLAVRHVQRGLKAQDMGSHDALSRGTAVWKNICKGNLFHAIDARELRKLLHRMKVPTTLEQCSNIVQELGEGAQLNFDSFVVLMSMEEESAQDEVAATIRDVESVFSSQALTYATADQMSATNAKNHRTNFDKVFLPLFFIYNLCMVIECPLTMAFQRFLFPDLRSESFKYHKICVTLCDLVLYVHYASQFLLAREVGAVMLHKTRDIVSHYVKSWEFVMDTVTALPLDVLVYISSIDAYSTMGLTYRMPRLLLLLRTDRLYTRVFDDVNPIASRILRTTMWFTLIIHYFACCFNVLAEKLGNDSTELFAGVPNYLDRSPLLMYLIAFDWAQKTMYGLSTGAPVPDDDAQVGFTLLTTLTGVAVLAILISSYNNAINAEGAEKQYHERIDQVRSFFKYIDTTSAAKWELASDIEAYYTHMFATMRSLRLDDDPLEEITAELRVLVTVELGRSLLLRVPMFNDLVDDPSFIYCIMQRCRARVLMPFEVVYQKGDAGTCMYIISCGLCVSWDGDGGPMEYVSGDYFGEIQLMHAVPRTATVECYDLHTNVYCLERKDFNDVIQHFPGFVKVVQNAIQTSVRDIIMSKRNNRRTDSFSEPGYDSAAEERMISVWLSTQERGVESETESVASKHRSIISAIENT
eukprot:PhM_4_TR11185/c0_g1_i1/m.13779